MSVCYHVQVHIGLWVCLLLPICVCVCVQFTHTHPHVMLVWIIFNTHSCCDVCIDGRFIQEFRMRIGLDHLRLLWYSIFIMYSMHVCVSLTDCLCGREICHSAGKTMVKTHSEQRLVQFWRWWQSRRNEECVMMGPSLSMNPCVCNMKWKVECLWM